MSLVRRESGASAVFVAATLLVLMGFAALAVDSGLGFNERRQAQSAADFSALAAVQFSYVPPDAQVPTECGSYINDSEPLARCVGAHEAIQVAQENLPGRTLDWLTCTDADYAATVGTFPNDAEWNGATLECIRFDATTQKARVVIPIIDNPTTFARVIGFSSVQVNAEAEVQADVPEISRTLPFAIPANYSTSYDCLKTGPNPDWGVCKEQPTIGNFGYLDIPIYGNPSLNTLGSADNCNPNNNSLVSNIVRGIDHNLGEHPTGVATASDPALNDDNGPDTASRKHVCPVFGSNANEVPTQTGNISGAFETGMIFGISGSEPGRIWGTQLLRDAGGGTPAAYVDNTPLWEKLSSSECGTANYGGSDDVDTTQEMIDCLESWVPTDGVIFIDGLRNETRYGFAPRLWEDFSSASDYLIRKIVPVYLHTSYHSCSSGGGGGNAGVCDIIHTPGIGDTGACVPVAIATVPGSEPPDNTCGIPGDKNDTIDAITAFILDERMVNSNDLPPFNTTGPRLDIALTK